MFSIVLEDFPEDGTPMSKHVGLDICHELVFMIYTLLYFVNCICFLLYWMQENARCNTKSATTVD